MRLLLAVLCVAACSPLSSTESASREGVVRVRAPRPPWHCAPNDADKDTYQHRGVKCVLDEGLVLSAKVYDVDTANVRTAEVFCVQDWKAEYASIIRTAAVYDARVVPFRGVPACEVTLEGTSTKGPWRLWEIHAPNGRKLLQITVSGSLPVWTREQRVIDAWRADLRYDLAVPGQ